MNANKLRFAMSALLASGATLAACQAATPAPQASPPASPAAAAKQSAPATSASAATVQSDGEDLGTKQSSATGPHPIEGLMQSLKSVPLPELAGKHPRVFATAGELTALQKRARTTHKKLWQQVLQNLIALKQAPPAPPAEERRAQNTVGLAIAEAALAYKIEKDPKYLAAAKKFMDAAVTYEVWGYRYNKPNVDLAAGHLLFGLGWAYDLLFDDLTPEERTKYRDKLTRQAKLLYEHDLPKAGKSYSYSQNHLFIPAAGLAVAAYALYGDVPEAAEWARLSRALMSRVLEASSEDGYLYEAFEYWVFSMPWLITWLEAHRHFTGEDLYERPGLRNMHLYLAHAVLPDGKNVFDFGDTFEGPKTRLQQGEDHKRTHPNGHLHSNYNILYPLAHRFGSAEIQGVAERMKDIGQVTAFGFMSLLWYDPAIKPAPIESLPSWHYFPDNEVVYYRSDWTAKATALAFKCGPPEGHAALEKLKRMPDWHQETGHAHPDAASFILFGKGQYLSGDSGYSGVPMTDQQNTLLFNGKGQAREGSGHNAFKGVPYERLNQITISGVELGQGKLKLVGHAAAAYEPELGVKQFDREITLVSPTELEIVDRLKTEAPATFTALVHADDAITKQSDGRYAIVRGNAALEILLSSPPGARGEVEPNALIGPGRPGSVSNGEREARGTRLRLSNATPLVEATFVTRLKIADAAKKP